MMLYSYEKLLIGFEFLGPVQVSINFQTLITKQLSKNNTLLTLFYSVFRYLAATQYINVFKYMSFIFYYLHLSQVASYIFYYTFLTSKIIQDQVRNCINDKRAAAIQLVLSCTSKCFILINKGSMTKRHEVRYVVILSN